MIFPLFKNSIGSQFSVCSCQMSVYSSNHLLFNTWHQIMDKNKTTTYILQ